MSSQDISKQVNDDKLNETKREQSQCESPIKLDLAPAPDEGAMNAALEILHMSGRVNLHNVNTFDGKLENQFDKLNENRQMSAPLEALNPSDISDLQLDFLDKEDCEQFLSPLKPTVVASETHSSPAESEPFAMPRSVVEAELVAQSKPVAKTDVDCESEEVPEGNSLVELKVMVKSEEAVDSEPVFRSEPMAKPEASVESETLVGPELMLESGTLVKPEPIVAPELVAVPEDTDQTDSIVESDVVAESKPLVESEPNTQVDVVAETLVESESKTRHELVPEFETLVEREMVTEHEPVIQPEVVIKTEVTPKPELESEVTTEVENTTEHEKTTESKLKAQSERVAEPGIVIEPDVATQPEIALKSEREITETDVVPVPQSLVFFEPESVIKTETNFEYEPKSPPYFTEVVETEQEAEHSDIGMVEEKHLMKEESSPIERPTTEPKPENKHEEENRPDQEIYQNPPEEVDTGRRRSKRVVTPKVQLPPPTPIIKKSITTKVAATTNNTPHVTTQTRTKTSNEERNSDLSNNNNSEEDESNNKSVETPTREKPAPRSSRSKSAKKAPEPPKISLQRRPAKRPHEADEEDAIDKKDPVSSKCNPTPAKKVALGAKQTTKTTTTTTTTHRSSLTSVTDRRKTAPPFNYGGDKKFHCDDCNGFATDRINNLVRHKKSDCPFVKEVYHQQVEQYKLTLSTPKGNKRSSR